MIPVVVTVGPLATADDDGIAQSQTPGAAGALTLNGVLVSAGVGILDVARRVLVTTAANESAKTLRITGTNADGNPIRETMTGPNATTGFTTQDFKTVTEVYASAAFTGAVTVGTNGVASSSWKMINIHDAPINFSIGVVTSGTVNYTVQYTYDRINNNQNQMGSQALGNYPTVPTVWTFPAMSAKTATADAAMDNPFGAWRLVVNSGATGSDSVTATAIQSGMIG